VRLKHQTRKFIPAIVKHAEAAMDQMSEHSYENIENIKDRAQKLMLLGLVTV
jgi:hypothetical protein